ncbi:MAG: DUF262 domain-containing protein [Campylobacterota bacterium]|nr:DUF262 domain-containing protein [Campylobacterota bacterium]
MQNNITSINQLLKLEFFIPSFQRGYRWNENQVNDLLEDIWEFFNISNKEEGEFYCLQPIIVKKENSRYRLIDGQQRITTIYLILSYLEFYMQRYKYDKFKIEYETRTDSKNYLEKIQNIESINEDNVDYYYMSQAFLYIKKWFEEYPEREIDFFNTLIKINLKDGKDIANNVRVIWYEILDSEDEIEVFTRINSGKIPLTNAELIKALFLNSKNFINEEKHIKQIEISKEWDEIEYTLQNDELWSFISKDKDYPTRIEMIFELLANENSSDKYATYRYFTKQKNIVDIWSTNDDNIKKIFLSFKYWFENRKLYHLIGFLISTNIKSIEDIYKDFRTKTKTEFEKTLYISIINSINLENIDQLEYGQDSNHIQKILLLFNIATILNNKDSYIRFSFDKFNNEKWSLEHIHAQQDKGLQSSEARNTWLVESKKQLEIIEEVNNEEVIQNIKLLLSKEKIEAEEFQEVQNQVINIFGEAEVDTIDNLALLTVGVNSSLSNSVFPIKRQILKQKDTQGEFIPICTKNVFLKYYSNDIKNIYFWSKEDRESYLKEMKLVLQKFVEIDDE